MKSILISLIKIIHKKLTFLFVALTTYENNFLWSLGKSKKSYTTKSKMRGESEKGLSTSLLIYT